MRLSNRFLTGYVQERFAFFSKGFMTAGQRLQHNGDKNEDTTESGPDLVRDSEPPADDAAVDHPLPLGSNVYILGCFVPIT